MKKCLLILMVFGATLGLNAQHNYDNQSVIYSDGGKVSIGNSTPTAKLTVQSGSLTPYTYGALRLIGNGIANLRMRVTDNYKH